MKLLPLTVSVKAVPPALAEVGERDATEGTGFGGGGGGGVVPDDEPPPQAASAAIASNESEQRRNLITQEYGFLRSEFAEFVRKRAILAQRD